MTEIKLTLDDLKDDGEHVEVWNLREHADVLGSKGFSWVASLVRNIADQIEEQVKPAIDEPTEFGSIVRARCPGQERDSEPFLWQQSATPGSKHYWESHTGAVEVWSELTQVEVLRIGVGDRLDVAPEETEDYKAGVTDTAYDLRRKLLDLRAEALTAERQNAYDKAIKLVEEAL